MGTGSGATAVDGNPAGDIPPWSMPALTARAAVGTPRAFVFTTGGEFRFNKRYAVAAALLCRGAVLLAVVVLFSSVSPCDVRYARSLALR
jgi:hypothetical protein